MTQQIQTLQPRKVFEYFEAISQIPRGSGNEKEISDYLVQFAERLGLWVKQDDAYNVYIKKPATSGYEKAPTVILQGHMDMVCEKNKETEHDFLKDPLKLKVEGDWLSAEGTTLGADDGIAVAYAMAILADDTLKHPALEVLITTDEERGMTGVCNMQPEHLEGTVLLNLDTEDEGEFLVSCAGGAKAFLTLEVKNQPVSYKSAYQIVIKGLTGGHSGSEIHHGRANAHLLMGRLLQTLQEAQIHFELCEITGGSKDNVITRECDVVLAVKPEDNELLHKVCKEMEAIFKMEYSQQDPTLELSMQEVLVPSQALSDETKRRLIEVLLLIPNGVQSYDPYMKGLVQASLNLGVVQMSHQAIHFASAVRSSQASRKQEMLEKLKVLSEVLGLTFEVRGNYPAWEYTEHSRIRELAAKVYEEMYHKKPVITSIHAGLECGFIAEKLPGLDMIAFGPDVKEAHSPNERLSISSTARVYAYLVALLENLAVY